MKQPCVNILLIFKTSEFLSVLKWLDGTNFIYFIDFDLGGY